MHPQLHWHSSVFFANESTNSLFLILLCKKSPLATGKGGYKFLQWKMLASTFLLFVFTQLNLSSRLMLLEICFPVTDLLVDLSRISATSCCMLDGIDMFFLSRKKSSSNFTFSWKISCLVMSIAFACAMLCYFPYRNFQMSQIKPSLLLHLVKSKMSQPFLLSENQGTDSNKQSLNLVLWTYLFTPYATRTCSRRDFGFFSMKTGEVSEVRAVSLIK